MSNETLDTEALARYLRKDVREVAKMADRGKLPGRKVGGQWRFMPVEINDWVANQLPDFSDAELTALDGHEAAHEEVAEPLLTNLLGEACIAVPLPGTTRASVLRELVKLAEQSWQVYDPDAVLEAVRQREEAGGTAMEGGVALPHPHRPMPQALGESVVAFGRTTAGMLFGALGRGLTDLFFLICCRDHKTHLRMLARVGRLVRKPGFLDALRAAETAVEVRRTVEGAEQELLATSH